MLTVDGFPIQSTISFLPSKPDPALNAWSQGKTLQVEVWYGDYWPNFIHGKYAKNVTWKGKTIRVMDYGWFVDLIKQWCDNKFYPMTREQAIDLYFEM